MYKLGLVGLALCVSLSASAQYNCQSTKYQPSAIQATTPINYNSRSDTADLVQLRLDIDTRGFSTKQLVGKAQYQIGAKMAFNELTFDLLGFTVDSVVSSTGPLSFTQSGEQVKVSESASIGDILQWTFYYHGTTTKDGSGWGGMHHDGAYHYNLGVGFAANPHVYGRSLFPCFDNFVEKCTLKEMNITTSPAWVGVSNGLLSGVDTLSSGDLVWKWEGQAPLPSYLVSVAVSDYFKQSWIHDGKPFEIYGRAQDTANMRAGFVHLNDMYDAFVDEFGPYLFEKVGYALTITGAMEHAGMVHLPRTLANANLAGEDIIAHELAHMWFGNAVTTQTAEDMWINEGFAEFGSHFYEEKVYGRAKYVQTVQNNQVVVLNQAAQNDGGHLALSGVNQNQTYGTHTYQKGAMVAHNLREFLGDSLFSHGVKQAISSNAFGNYDATSFKLAFEAATGVDLDDFWNDWIATPGYHGTIAQLKHGQGSNWSVSEKDLALHHVKSDVPSGAATTTNSVKQVLYKHSINYGYQGRLDLGISSSYPENSSSQFVHEDNLDLGGGTDYWVSMNDSSESLGTSVYDTFKWSDLNGTTTLPHTGVKITPRPNTNNLNGTFYVWHHRTNEMYGDEYWVSPHHVYFIAYEGSHDPPLSADTEMPFEVTVRFNTNASQEGLDRNLSGLPSDSMTVVYQSQSYWLGGQPLPNVGIQSIGNFGIGNLSFVPQKLFGFYRIGNTVPLRVEEQQNLDMKLFPNPSNGQLNIQYNDFDGMKRVEVIDSTGRRVLKKRVRFEAGHAQLELQELAEGAYTLVLGSDSAVFILK